MKMAALVASTFSDQIGVVVSWFSSWSECEKVVALYCLLRKLPVVQTKFLSQVVDQILSTSTNIDDIEEQANDPGFVSSFTITSECCDLTSSVRALLHCLPLLRTGNTAAKSVYLRVIPTVLRRATETGRHLADCQQILSYALIHPAISADELTVLSTWQSRLMDETMGGSGSQQPTGVPGNGNTAGCPLPVTTNGSTSHGHVPVASADRTSSSGVCGGAGGSGIIGQPIVNGISGSGYVHGHRDLTKVWSLPFESSMSGSPGSGNMASGVARIGRPIGGSGSNLVGVQFEPTPIVPSNAQQPNRSVAQRQGSGLSATGHQKLTRASTVAVPPSGIPEWVRHSVEFGNTGGSSRRDANSASVVGSRLSVGGLTDPMSHVPLSPQSSDASSGSGGGNADGDDSSNAGMQEVSVWLKSLRLHKYSGLFQHMTYDEMMNLNEEWLEARGVTKGARNKILISVKKLNERPQSLRQLEKDVIASGNVWSAIGELRQILNTPIRAVDPSTTTTTTTDLTFDLSATMADAADIDAGSPGGGDTDRRTCSESETLADQDLPGLVTRVFGKLCTQLLVTMRPDNDCLTNYLHLLDKCINHLAFTEEQRKKMLSWRQQIQRVLQFQQQRHHRAAASSASLPPVSQSRVAVPQRALRGQSPGGAVQQPTWTFIGSTAARGSTGSGGSIGGHPVATWQASAPPPQYNIPGTASLAAYCPPRLTSQLDQSPPTVTMKQPLSRTQSAPLRSAQQVLSIPSLPVMENDSSGRNEELHASLNSLCISMMEAAMGGSQTDTL